MHVFGYGLLNFHKSNFKNYLNKEIIVKKFFICLLVNFARS